MSKEKEKVIQIPVVAKNNLEFKDLVLKCKEVGYKIHHGLDDIESIKDKIVAVIIDTESKDVFCSNRSCMCYWSAGIRRPLIVGELITYFDELVIKRNNKLYESLLEDAKNDKSRPIGCLISVK